MKITDKELLAICNFSNLRMEFAEVNYTDDYTKNEVNHTIYSLLEKEINAINNNLKEKADRGFFKELGDISEEKYLTPREKEEILREDKIIYNTTMDIKKEAGVVYEYFEKYNLGNSEGAFTEEWKILYAADSYKIISEFYDMFRKISKLSFTFVDEETDEEVVYYKVMDDDLLRKTINGEQVEVDNEDIKEYEELVNSLSDEKLYPSRRYIQELKKQKKHLEILFMVIDILSVALPIKFFSDLSLKSFPFSYPLKHTSHPTTGSTASSFAQ